MLLGGLVEDLDPFSVSRRVFHRQLDALDRVLDVDEGPGLAAGAVHGQGMAHRRLHHEPVEHGAVVAVVVEAVDEPLIQARFVGLGSPDDALVQVCDAQAVVLVVVGEHECIHGLGQVVDASRLGRVGDLHLLFHAVHVDLDGHVAFGDRHAHRAVAVDAGGAQVHQVNVQARLDDGAQDVVGGVDVVVHRVTLVRRALHRIGRGALLGKVDGRLRLDLFEEAQHPVVVVGKVDVAKFNLLSGHLLPCGDPLVDRLDRRQRIAAQLDVDLSPRKVVDNDDVVARLGQKQARRPSAEPVAAEYDDGIAVAHDTPPMELITPGSSQENSELRTQDSEPRTQDPDTGVLNLKLET